MASLSSLSLTR